MDDHAGEEDGVEPGEWALEPCDQTPRDGKEEIACVVNLPRLSVPTIAQDAVSALGRDRLGVVDLAVSEVGEGGALVNGAAFFLAELVLLGVGRVPDVVDTKVGDGEKSREPDGELVLGRMVEGDIERAVAVGEGHTGHVPEDKHETELFVVHIPRGTS